VFDIGWSEMAVVLLVALVVIGPKDLPRVARTLGKWVTKGRAMAREFQSALEDMAREAELDKVKSEIEKAGRTDLGTTIENTIDPTGELGQAFDPTARSRPRAKHAASTRVPLGSAGTAADPVLPAGAEPSPGAAPAVDPARGSAADPSTGNGQAAEPGTEPRTDANGSGSKAPEPTAAPADPR
jgi:sec-independent protein translocase protein TatB